MKKVIAIVLAAGLVMSVVGCEDESTRYVEVDRTPAIPQGVYSITADEAVYIYWLPVREADLDFYRIWWSDEADGNYELVGTSDDESYVDDDVDNGTTYFYAVSAVDFDGNESDLSYETVFDTPRPEGFDVSVYDFNIDPDHAGFDLSAAQVIPYNAAAADFYIDWDDELLAFFINVSDENTDIQDMGYTQNFDEIGYAPSDGYSYVGWSEVIEGHTYIIWTRDDHFAKVRVTYADYDNLDNIIFDWGYQPSEGDLGRMELARPQHDEDYLRHDIKTKNIDIVKGQ